MRKLCATVAVFLAGITGTLCVNFNSISSMSLPQCQDICSDSPSIVDAISFSNSTVILTFSKPRNCSAEVVSYITTYGCSQHFGVIDQFGTLNTATTNSSNFQKINLLIAEEITDWECAFIVQAIIQLPNGTSCITMCSACTIFNVSFYASHQSTSLEGNCLPISACPRIPDFPMFAVTFCSKIIQRPIVHASSDIRKGKVPYLYILHDNDTGSEEVCVNETYINLTTLIARCADPEDNATLSCNNNPNICLRLRARLLLINSTCEPATELPSTTATTLSSASTGTESTRSIDCKAWAIATTILMSFFFLLFVATLTTVKVIVYVCQRYI